MLPSIQRGRAIPLAPATVNSDAQSTLSPPSPPLIDFSSSVVELRGKHLTPSILGMLGEALATSAVINTLDLSDNPSLGDGGMLHVAALLEANPNIRVLGLGRTGITRWGVESVCLAAAAHNALVALDLSGNVGVDDYACLELCKWLSLAGTRLTSLRLVDTSVGPRGAAQLMEGVARCGTMTSVVLPFHVGRHIHSAVDGLLASRVRAMDRAKQAAVEERRMVYAGRGPAIDASVDNGAWSCRAPLVSSPRLEAPSATSPGVLRSSMADWGGGLNKGALMCLSLLEAKGSQRDAALASSSERRAALHPSPRSGRLGPLVSPRGARGPVGGGPSGNGTLGDYLSRLQ